MEIAELEKRVTLLETQNAKIMELLAYLLAADKLSQEVHTNLNIIVTVLHNRLDQLESEVL